MANFALRIPDDLKAEATDLARATGQSLNQLIANALSSKVAADKAAKRYFEGRGKNSAESAQSILARAGVGNSPRPDDV